MNPQANTERVRGMVNLPLSAEGQAEANHFGQRIAAKGGVDTVVTSHLDRARQTAAAILKHNPNARLLVDGEMDARHEGGLEGMPTDEAQPELKYFATHPDQAIPGVGISGVPGESVVSHSKRMGHGIMRHLADLKPGERRLMVEHHSTLRFLRGWKKRGFPRDFSIESKEMLSKPHTSAPESPLLRLVKHPSGKPDLEEDSIESDNPIKPGLTFAFHAATPWSSKPPAKLMKRIGVEGSVNHMPGTADVGENIKELQRSSTKRPRKQIIAIALSQAREAGANIPKKRTMDRMKVKK